VFLREPGFLDRALAVRTALFDKTGTLTRGRLALAPAARQALVALSDEARAVLAAMAARSNHPASRALAGALGAASGETAASGGIDGLEETPGEGLEWRRNGETWRLGRPAFAVPDAVAPDGETWFAADSRRLAAFAFREEIKADVGVELAALAARGLDVRVLSGDAEGKVQAVATAIGLPADRAEGGLSPEAKAARVRELDRRDTLMVGDGINDAPAFAAAFCTATPAVDRPQLPARADFYFLGDGISAVRHALEAAARWRRVVWANLAFALAYNALALALSFAGLVTPLLAAVLMPASSLTVVTHTIARLAGRRVAWRS
jgi:Cu2+-exporting ATPase